MGEFLAETTAPITQMLQQSIEHGNCTRSVMPITFFEVFYRSPGGGIERAEAQAGSLAEAVEMAGVPIGAILDAGRRSNITGDWVDVPLDALLAVGV